MIIHFFIALVIVQFDLLYLNNCNNSNISEDSFGITLSFSNKNEIKKF